MLTTHNNNLTFSELETYSVGGVAPSLLGSKNDWYISPNVYRCLELPVNGLPYDNASMQGQGRPV
ncbi:MAG: hypothetical protein M3294_02210 [Pseudomonadota bacterium]|nr:hypothetical protein [Pseudomonadota bacterium]